MSKHVKYGLVACTHIQGVHGLIDQSMMQSVCAAVHIVYQMLVQTTPEGMYVKVTIIQFLQQTEAQLIIDVIAYAYASM